MDIHVRRLTFDFSENFSVLPNPNDIRGSCELLGVCFTLPYLEPYLIRTMTVALKHVTEPSLAEDMRRFSGQEGNHYRSHAAVNDMVRERLSADTAEEITQIEAELKADYRRFTKEKSLRFNLAYAEGFEAMTLAFTLAGMGRNPDSFDPAWRDLVEWHGAEEIEHRTVAYDAYRHICGSYPYRLLRGTWAQIHYVNYIRRFTQALRREFAHLPVGTYSGNAYRTIPGYLRTFLPWYDPSRIEPSDYVHGLLQKYDARALG